MVIDVLRPLLCTWYTERPPKNDVSVGLERKTLRTLQLCADDFCLTRSGEQSKNKAGKDDALPKIISSKKQIAVFEDPVPDREIKTSKLPDGTEVLSSQTECTCRCHEKTEEERLYELMTAEPTLQEWKKLAEERRQALEETLVENRQLHFEIVELKNEIKSLNNKVSNLKEERDYFASVLQNALNDDEDDGSSSPESDPVTADSYLTSADVDGSG
ncbi:hypothetical protein LSH36_62g01066 [Paralvinella palmiformis]|uniref:Geminin n=1 Tax=Paralvinella palmiformis TaxID=53620 RepID=A0AAD9K540_9ANNE|nr:hypothetical protein LSH36_62g01066 [Paralvinella palmiformis]